MGNLSILESIINSRMQNLHTAFLGKVIAIKDERADIQPLQYGSPIIPNIPMTRSVKTGTLEINDIVICLCCERNITTALKGEMPVESEPKESFAMSNAVIVGVL